MTRAPTSTRGTPSLILTTKADRGRNAVQSAHATSAASPSWNEERHWVSKTVRIAYQQGSMLSESQSQPNRAGTCLPPSTILIGRPIGLIISLAGSTLSEWHKRGQEVGNRDGMVLDLGTRRRWRSR